jgi:hypothetical protein
LRSWGKLVRFERDLSKFNEIGRVKGYLAHSFLDDGGGVPALGNEEAEWMVRKWSDNWMPLASYEGSRYDDVRIHLSSGAKGTISMAGDAVICADGIAVHEGRHYQRQPLVDDDREWVESSYLIDTRGEANPR